MNNLPATTQLNQFVVLRKGHNAVKGIPPSVLKQELTDILTVASADAGQDFGKNTSILIHQTECLFKELRGKFGDLTLPEIREAFRMGVRSEFGPWFGFCPKTYHQFVKGYYDLPERSKTWMAYLDEQDQGEVATKPVHYTPEKWIEMSKLTFQQYKESKGKAAEHGESSGGIYDRAEGIKVNVQKAFWTNGAAAAIYDCINSHLGSQHPKYPDRKTLVPDKEIRDTLLAIAAEEVERMEKEKPGSTGQKTLEFIQKKRLLMYYFDELINQNKDLEI